jgi:hypothetical protein
MGVTWASGIHSVQYKTFILHAVHGRNRGFAVLSVCLGLVFFFFFLVFGGGWERAVVVALNPGSGSGSLFSFGRNST